MEMKFKKLMSMALVGVMTLATVAGCTSGQSSNKDTFKIGGIGPLTGPAAIYGTNVMNAAQIAVDVEYKSYLLDPTTPIDATGSVYEELQKKYGMSLAEVKNMTSNVAARAKEVGLDYNFDNMKSANTVKAHRLAKWAETKGKGKEFTERLLQAYFIEGLAIGQTEVLLTLVEQLGLHVDEAREIMAGEQFADEVQQDISVAQQLLILGKY